MTHIRPHANLNKSTIYQSKRHLHFNGRTKVSYNFASNRIRAFNHPGLLSKLSDDLNSAKPSSCPQMPLWTWLRVSVASGRMGVCLRMYTSRLNWLSPTPRRHSTPLGSCKDGQMCTIWLCIIQAWTRNLRQLWRKWRQDILAQIGLLWLAWWWKKFTKLCFSKLHPLARHGWAYNFVTIKS